MDLWKIITAQFADLVTITYPCLWKDEDNEPVLITRKMEISRWGDNELCLLVWSAPSAALLRSSGLISREWETDDLFDTLFANTAKLPQILQLGGVYRKRPRLTGKWIHQRMHILGHRLIPSRPVLPGGLEMPQRNKARFNVMPLCRVKSAYAPWRNRE